MQFIIDKDGMKRELNGSFQICGSAANLRRLAHVILDAVGDDADDPRFTYGWIEVHEPLETATNQKPAAWID